MSQSLLVLTPAQAAQQLGIGRSTLYRLLACGELESVKVGAARRIPSAALEEYVARLRSGAAAS